MVLLRVGSMRNGARGPSRRGSVNSASETRRLYSGRRPWSVSAARTHLRNVSAVIPSLLEIELIAAHWDSYSRSCSKTKRTARSRTSAGCLVALLMAPSSQGLEPPRKPGRFTSSIARPSRVVFGERGGSSPGSNLRRRTHSVLPARTCVSAAGPGRFAVQLGHRLAALFHRLAVLVLGQTLTSSSGDHFGVP